MRASRHRRQPAISRVGLLVLVVVVAGSAAGAWLVRGKGLALHNSACAAGVTVRLAAAPELAPAISVAARDWIGGCVQVTAADPADLAESIARKFGGATLPGLQASTAVAVPDVWIPDSSMWLAQLQDASVTGMSAGSGAASSVASSPIVLAVVAPTAAQMGWPKTGLTWTALTGQLGATQAALRAGMVAPARDAAAQVALLSMVEATRQTPVPAPSASAPAVSPSMVAAVRALTPAADLADLESLFPTSLAQMGSGQKVVAAPMSEQAVVAYNSINPPIALDAFYLPGSLALDYPYTMLPGMSAATQAAAEQFQSVLSGSRWANLLAKHGLRSADGHLGSGFAAQAHSPGVVTSGAPLAHGAPVLPGNVDIGIALRQAIEAFEVLTEPGQMLAVLDVSGSMVTPVATAAGQSREQVTVASAARGLGLLSPAWTVGLWTFSSDQGPGRRPWTELVPLGPLADNQDQLVHALGQVVPNPTGNTGLYNTIYDAYRTVQQSWKPNMFNSIVVMTDGQEDDPNNPNAYALPALIDALKQIVDTDKPIDLIIVGIGDAPAAADLKQITDLTGGGFYSAKDPTTISDIFLEAIAQRVHS